MNKKLLAICISFATMATFATATQSNKTELLIKLRQIKTEIEYTLDMHRNFGEPMSKHQFKNDNDYNDIENASLEMYHLADKVITPFIETTVDALCNGEELPDYSTVIAECLTEDFINKHKDEITTILDKYSKNDTQAHKNSTITLEQRLIDYFSKVIGICDMIAAREFCTALLQRIDAKITELEIQQ